MIAIIPARGGSKGLPKKNIKLLNGIPLICHTIKTALESKSIHRVIVSTDDEEIAKISKNCGADVPFMRPISLAMDDSMVMDTYFHVIDKIREETKSQIDSFVALLPTVPLRLADDIDNAVKIFKSYNADSVISVVKAPVPIEWYRKITNKGILENYLPEFNATRNRQEFKEAYVPNGSIYVFRVEPLRSKREYYNKKTYPYIMPSERSVDIDYSSDFEWAEFLLKKKLNE